MKKLRDLVAVDVVVWSKALDVDLWWTAEDKLEEHQMSCAEAARGGLKEEPKEEDVRLERDGHRIK